MYEYQYVVGGALSLFVSIYILLKRPRSLALKFLFLFGLVVSLWEFSCILSNKAPNVIAAANLFKIVLLTSHLCFPLYLLTILTIREDRSRKVLLLSFLPAVIQMVVMLQADYFVNYQFFRSKFGWVYRVVSYQLPLIVVSVVFIGYLLGIFVVLLRLTVKTRFPLLKRKYTILLVSFTLFQVVGTTLTNALLAFDLIDPNLRVGGILQFLTFLSIWYALSLKEEEIPLSFMKGKDFLRVYSSFLTVFYNSTIRSQLGEDTFKFTDFITKSKIENQVTVAKNEIVFEETEDLDLITLITRNLNFFDKNPIGEEIIDRYLRVLNVADQKLGWRFEAVVKANESFLKKSDLIYGISGGKFLEKIVGDESLRDLEDIEVCLKIYKRILLPIMDKIQAKTEFRKKLSTYYVTKAMEITDYGEISIKGVKDHVLKIPKDRRLPLVIESFNSILSWAYERILMDPRVNVKEMLRKLRLVLTLNKDKAVALGIYPTLLGMLATKIPKTQIHRLYSDYLEELVEERTRELKEAQENLLKSQRLAAIGEAAAMVGHDLRNPLQVIVNTLYLARKKLESSPNKSLEDILETIGEQVGYINKIVSDLEDYSRPLKPKLEEVSLNQLINETLSTLTVPENVKVFVVIENDLDFPKLIVDPSFMKRVFTNLITNAIQAMPDGGQLTISAYETGEAALISFKDTGVGIPKENLDKIFQPLFTTKSKGQGLGLAVCKRLIESLDGSIMVESEVGKGSTFTVKIPLKLKNASDKRMSKFS